MRAAVVGHIEWVEFLPVDGQVAPGAILRASASFAEAAGGGGVAAAELSRLAGASTIYTALGSDSIGQGVPAALAPLGVTVVAKTRDESQRRGVTILDTDHERTIVVIGPAQGPRGAEMPSLAGVDAVYFCKGDAEALRVARQARVLVATARCLPIIRESGVQLDALVHSGNDPSEVYRDGDLDPAPRMVATTDGSRGGVWRLDDGTSGMWASAPLPGQPMDAYGAGDSFAAALTFGLANGLGPQGAVDLGAERGALAMCRRGAHGVSRG